MSDLKSDARKGVGVRVPPGVLSLIKEKDTNYLITDPDSAVNNKLKK